MNAQPRSISAKRIGSVLTGLVLIAVPLLAVVSFGPSLAGSEPADVRVADYANPLTFNAPAADLARLNPVEAKGLSSRGVEVLDAFVPTQQKTSYFKFTFPKQPRPSPS